MERTCITLALNKILWMGNGMSIKVVSAEDKARLLRALHTLGGPPPGFKFWWSYQWPRKVVSRKTVKLNHTKNMPKHQPETI